MNLQFCHHCQTQHEPRQALQAVQKAQEQNPHSIFAHILAGGLMEAQSDLGGALATYEAAKSQFYRQHPDSYEPPLYLIDKTTSFTAKLEEKEPR
jgi:lipopolysaccharide biosynthesis regulator YciM